MANDLFDILLGSVCELDKVSRAPKTMSAEQQNNPMSLSNLYLSKVGYNRTRQRILESIYNNNKTMFEKILGRPITKTGSYKRNDDIIEISKREGWKFFDIEELQYDIFYRKITNMQHLPPTFIHKDRYKVVKSQLSDSKMRELTKEWNELTEQDSQEKGVLIALFGFGLLSWFIGGLGDLDFTAAAFFLILAGILICSGFICWYRFTNPVVEEKERPPYICPCCGADSRYIEHLRYTGCSTYLVYARGMDLYRMARCEKCGKSLMIHEREVFGTMRDPECAEFLGVEEYDGRFDNEAM